MLIALHELMLRIKAVFPKESLPGNWRLLALAGLLVIIFYPMKAKSDSVSVDGLWTERPSRTLAASGQARNLPKSYRSYTVDEKILRKLLAKAAYVPTKITIPMPDGRFVNVRIEESSILSPELQRKHPEFRTYRGVGVNDPSLTVRLDRTPSGFHGFAITNEGSAYINPAAGLYLSYWKKEFPRQPFQCYANGEQEGGDNHFAPYQPSFRSPTKPSGDTLRTYRLIISATGEYYQFVEARDCSGSTDPSCGETATQNQIITTINRVNGIYEREVSIAFNLVEFNIYDDPDTDPFTDSVNSQLLDENQADLDSKFGSGSYDIGHVFSAVGGGGLAARGVCLSNKARGGTSLTNPSGDVFDVDYVAHEMGHQFSGSHTFNGTESNCGGNRVDTSAYEPGSGSTIMGYAGICGSQNVQPNSNDYFHTRSFDQITDYREGDGSCGTESATGNNAPVVDAGPDATIPRETPFTLVASGSDPDSDELTYNWEQFDLGAAQTTQLPDPSSTGPLFRSRPSAAETWRTFPLFDDILDDTAEWEVLPNTNRSLTFRVTARDGIGGVDYDDMTVTVAGSPFTITYPDSGDILECGDADTLAWTPEVPEIASNVRATFSGDDGLTFPEVLLADTPNDGTEAFTVPTSLTDDGRVLLEPIDQMFFDVSGRFSIEDSLAPALEVPEAVTGFECTSPIGTAVPLGTPSASDLCDSAPTIINDAPDLFPLGSTTVTWTATDESENSDFGTQLVEVVDTTPPSINAPSDLNDVECTSPAGASPELGTADASDQCDSSPSVTNNAPAVFPLYPPGPTTLVTWTATDSSGNTATDNQNVTVVDTTPPLLTPPDDIVEECSSAAGTPVDIGYAESSDTCDVAVDISNDAPSLFPLGLTTVTWSSVDDFLNTSTATQNVTVEDTTPPVFDYFSITPTMLWPPNHKMIKITVTLSVSDTCDDTLAVSLASITSNEPDNGIGDGNTENDIQEALIGLDDREFLLRAERSGRGTGRLYTITYMVQDDSGNMAFKSGTVTVPHSNN